MLPSGRGNYKTCWPLCNQMVIVYGISVSQGLALSGKPFYDLTHTACTICYFNEN